MKLVSKCNGILAILLIVPFIAKGNDCATISFKSSMLGGEQYLYELVTSNGQQMKEAWNKAYVRRVFNGSQTTKMEAGIHSIDVSGWRKQDYSYLLKMAATKPVSGISIPAEIRIEKNKHYTYSVKNGEKLTKQPLLTLESVQDKSCDFKKKRTLPAKVANELLTGKLPEPLEENLRNVMNQLANNSLNTSNFIPGKISYAFGATFAPTFVDGNIKVIAVQPFSLANKMGLLSGDLITHLGNKAVSLNDSKKMPYQMLYDLFKSRDIGRKFQLIVSRSNKTITLESRTDIVQQSGISYRTGNKIMSPDLVNRTPIDKKLNFELSHVVSEIQQYILAQGLPSSIYSISRKQSEQIDLGLNGKLTRLQENFAFQVSSIESSSLASHFKLQAGDSVLAVNGQPIRSNSIKELVLLFDGFQQGDMVNLLVIRAGEQKLVKTRYQMVLNQAFSITFAIEKKDELIASINSSNRRLAYRERKNRFSYDSQRSSIVDYEASQHRSYYSESSRQVRGSTNSGSSKGGSKGGDK